MSGQTMIPIYSQYDTDVSDSVRNATVAQEYVLSLDNRRATLETVGGKEPPSPNSFGRACSYPAAST